MVIGTSRETIWPVDALHTFLSISTHARALNRIGRRVPLRMNPLFEQHGTLPAPTMVIHTTAVEFDSGLNEWIATALSPGAAEGKLFFLERTRARWPAAERDATFSANPQVFNGTHRGRPAWIRNILRPGARTRDDTPL